MNSFRLILLEIQKNEIRNFPIFSILLSILWSKWCNNVLDKSNTGLLFIHSRLTLTNVLILRLTQSHWGWHRVHLKKVIKLIYRDWSINAALHWNDTVRYERQNVSRKYLKQLWLSCNGEFFSLLHIWLVLRSDWEHWRLNLTRIN